MSYLDLFQRYGNPSREAEIRLTAYLLRPDALTADRIKNNDDSAARMIARCNELIDQLTEYRAALAERYAALATAAYRDRLELTRERRWRDSPVLYHVQIVRTLMRTAPRKPCCMSTSPARSAAQLSPGSRS